LESSLERIRQLETQVRAVSTSLAAVTDALDRIPDPEAETAGERELRYLRSPMEECSDPELWTQFHGHNESSHDSDSDFEEGVRETVVTVSDPVLYYSLISEQRRPEGSSAAADIERSPEEMQEARDRAQEAICERVEQAAAVGNGAAVEYFQAQAFLF